MNINSCQFTKNGWGIAEAVPWHFHGMATIKLPWHCQAGALELPWNSHGEPIGEQNDELSKPRNACIWTHTPIRRLIFSLPPAAAANR